MREWLLRGSTHSTACQVCCQTSIDTEPYWKIVPPSCKSEGLAMQSSPQQPDRRKGQGPNNSVSKTISHLPLNCDQLRSNLGYAIRLFLNGKRRAPPTPPRRKTRDEAGGTDAPESLVAIAATLFDGHVARLSLNYPGSRVHGESPGKVHHDSWHQRRCNFGR